MNAEIFAEWLRRQGHSVVRTTSSYWYDKSSRVYQAFPYHWIIQPTEEELINFYKVAEIINNMISNKQIYNQKEHSLK